MNDDKNQPFLNTQELLRIWDNKYADRNQNSQVFSGNVEGYQYKKLLSSKYIVLNNPSRITKKVNKIGHPVQPNPNYSTKPKTPKPERVFLQLKQEHFYFHKIIPQQVLIYLKQDMKIIHLQEGQNLLFRNQQNKQTQRADVHAIIVNKVPICPYHCLFIPWINGKKMEFEGKIVYKKLEQKIIVEALPLALTLLDIYKDLVVGFNSVGAAASVNNLHFQMFFKQSWIGDEQIPVSKILKDENTWRMPILTQKLIGIESFSTEDMQGFVIHLSQNYGVYEIQLSYSILQILIEKNIAHNLMINKKGNGKEMWIFVRNFQSQETKLGCMEFSGVFCLDFLSTTREVIENKYKEMKLAEDLFEDVQKTLSKQLSYQILLNHTHQS